MFTNAGMNQFKEIFLGNAPIKHTRIVDSQKCLRVSGKHNDLDEVGKDTYHHTMFEMLGNWSFGDYFKEEAIALAWEFLTEVMELDKSRLYATVFQGDDIDKTEADLEAKSFWTKYLPDSHILFGNKKDNFWEMGDSGPCGPCSEIHIDLRDEEDIAALDGALLINKDHPLVVEIWNLVFIQFNRLTSGELQPLAHKHVDTGMGFERLCMAVQGKKSNYDTDIFQPILQKIASIAQKNYGQTEVDDIAMRVIADHLRAVSFAIADGQMPSNTGAGYVIRRILRRAIRYGFTFLRFNEPTIYLLVPVLVNQMGEQYPELVSQKTLIEKVIKEEEVSFLRTLASGIQRFENYCNTIEGRRENTESMIAGAFAFELFDTYGFPIDLTQLMAEEKGLKVDMEGFHKGLEEQKNRSRAAAAVQTDDWVELIPNVAPTQFVGYTTLECTTKILKYRKVQSKGKSYFQLVLDITPFYAESGGQIGDTGVLESVNEKIMIENTIKENNLIIHITQKLPENLTADFTAKIDEKLRQNTQNNHSATHLLHYAMRQILGTHVEQKGSLVTPERLRFDFSHFSKVTDEELDNIETLANELVRDNLKVESFEAIPIEEAKAMGALALFGEKYGDEVRVIRLGESIELCGGTHTSATGNIGFIKITSEGAIAAGIRRIEAVTGATAEKYVNLFVKTANEIKLLFNSPNIIQTVQKLMQENDLFRKEIETFKEEKIQHFITILKEKIEDSPNSIICCRFPMQHPEVLKQAAYQLRNSKELFAVVFATDAEEKVNIVVALSDKLVEKGLNASLLVKEISPIIQGGGGGQPTLSTAGGKNCAGIDDALQKIEDLIMPLL